RRAEQALEALVVGVGDESDARGDQLGSRRLDVDGCLAVGPVERDLVERTRIVARLELGLGDRRLEGHVPQPRGLGLVGLAAREVAHERRLGYGLRATVDGL